jgi:hypothetical protein
MSSEGKAGEVCESSDRAMLFHISWPGGGGGGERIGKNGTLIGFTVTHPMSCFSMRYFEPQELNCGLAED